MDVVLVNAAATATRVDGIDAYTRCLALALDEAGHPTALVTRREDCWEIWRPPEAETSRLAHSALVPTLTSGRCLVVQYNPFSWGRRGFAPDLLRLVRAVGQANRRPTIAVMLHERFTPFGSPGETLMSTWQRIQLRALARLADIGFASTEPWVGQDKFGPRRTRSQLLPVGSNLPDARSERSSQRHLMGLTADDVVLATFGTYHPSFLSGHVIRSANALSAHSPVTLLNLGAHARPFSGLHPGVKLLIPGEMPTHKLAATLAAADIYLAPFSDGVSTRRTTVAAALQHALPVVGTVSHSTGPLLRNAPGLVLADSDDPDGFVEAVLRFGRSADERQRVAVHGRAFFDELLSWPQIAARLMSAL